MINFKRVTKTFLYLIFVIGIFHSQQLFATEFRVLGSVRLPHKMVFQGTTLGGLSGLTKTVDGAIWAVSDDRQMPRLYELEINFDPKNLEVKPKSVLKLKVDKKRVLDLEGISVLPWGNFLLSSEGDLNHKPRVMPELIDVKKDGSLPTSYEVPTDFLPELSGQQKKGIRNNLAFEGLSAAPSGQKWMMATEGALVQDPADLLRFVEYTMPEAWVIRPSRQLRYQLTKKPGDLQGGISEILWKTEDRIWVLERFANLKQKFRLQLVEVEVPEMGKESTNPLVSRTLLDLNSILVDSDQVQNYEGLLLGPTLASGEKTLVLVSDDNFSSALQTRFLFLAFKE